MATVEELLSRIDGGYEHLATKADLYQLENRMYRLENRMIRWLGGKVIALGILAVSVAGSSIPSRLSLQSLLHYLNLLFEVPSNRVVRPYIINRMSIQNRPNLVAFRVRQLPA